MDVDKLLRIDTSRLIAARTLIREVFLYLPTNRKLVRLARGGDELRESLLARLLLQPHARIYVIPREGAPEDPESCPLFVEEPAAAPQAAAKNAVPESATPIAPSAASEGEATTLPPSSEEEEMETSISADPAAEADVRNVGAASSSNEEVSKVKALGLLLDASVSKVRTDAVADEKDTAHAPIPEPEHVRSFSNEATVEDLHVIQGDRATEAGHQLRAKAGKAAEAAASPAEGNEADLAGVETLGDVASRLLSASTTEGAEGVRKQAKEVREVIQGMHAAALAGDEEKSRLLAEELRESAAKFRSTVESEGSDRIRAHADELDEAIRIFSPAPSEEGLRKIREEAAPASTFDSTGMLADAAAALTVLKASEELTRAALALADADANFGALERKIFELQAIIEEVSVTGKANPRLQDRFDVKGDLKELEQVISEGHGGPAMEDLYRKAEEAKTAAMAAVSGLSKPTGEKSADPLTFEVIQGTELPAVVGRLAATLSVALGYTEVKYLYEVSLGAILYFALKEGENVQETDLPPLTRALMHAQPAGRDFACLDGSEVITFLDAYLHSPACDRTRRDLSKRTLVQTLEQLSSIPNGPDDWSKARWTQFATLGPTIEAQSLCAKASAWALRDSKELVS